MSAAKHPPFSGECRNCATSFVGHYCPECGQEAHIEVPSGWEFLHEFFGHYVALEGRLIRTLKTLLFAPGQLTLDYLEGRRQCHVRPLRLYLSCSVLFFLVLALTEHFNESGIHEGAAQEKAAVSSAAPAQKKLDSADAEIDRKVRAALAQAGKTSPASAPATQSLSIQINDEDDSEPSKPSAGASSAQGNTEAGINIKGDGLVTIGNWHGRIDSKQTLETFKHHIPHAIFALLPAFAAILALLYRSRRQRYGAHFLFALHLHAFAFLWLIPPLLIPEQPPQWLETLNDYWVWGLPIYLALALRRVYGGRWRPVILRILALFSLYGVAALVAVVALAIAAAMGSVR
ncbi:DUF3667 domain-containing protein [Niveibacterium terrae]|uniref:DUF3667 domain-containing protein n=1 Tax=Niveibacterium terrae TaxID=3373598 RepID=UPI003A8FD886